MRHSLDEHVESVKEWMRESDYLVNLGAYKNEQMYDRQLMIAYERFVNDRPLLMDDHPELKAKVAADKLRWARIANQ